MFKLKRLVIMIMLTAVSGFREQRHGHCHCATLNDKRYFNTSLENTGFYPVDLNFIRSEMKLFDYEEITMKEHTKLSEEEFVKLNNTLLQLNGTLLRLGINKEDTHIVLPKSDWVYFNNVLSSGQSSISKYYQSVSDKEFTLSGVSITYGVKDG